MAGRAIMNLSSRWWRALSGISEHPLLFDSRSGDRAIALGTERILTVVYPERVESESGEAKETIVVTRQERVFSERAEGRRLPHPAAALVHLSPASFFLPVLLWSRAIVYYFCCYC